MNGRVAQLLVVAMVSFPLVAASKPGALEYRVLRNHSLVEFTILKWGVYKETGRFTRFEGTLKYGDSDSQPASIEMTVEASSIDTGMPLRDSILRGDDFLDAGRYPTMTFRGTAKRRGNPRSLWVTGELTVRGISRHVEFPAAVTGVSAHRQVGPIAGFEASFTIDRTWFGVSGDRWSGGRNSLSRNVEMRVRIGSAGADG